MSLIHQYLCVVLSMQSFPPSGITWTGTLDTAILDSKKINLVDMSEKCQVLFTVNFLVVRVVKPG